MKDVFKIWEPGFELVRNKYLHGIYDDYNGLKIKLQGIDESDKMLTITFRSHFVYMSANESFRLKSLHDDDFSNGINFSTDTRFLRWLKAESHGIYDDSGMVHYLICSNDDITDVISREEPTLSWI